MITLHFISKGSTSQPNDIQNAHKCMLHNITIYTCMSGYQSNGAKGVVAYNGSYWEETDYNCTGKHRIH